MTEKGIAVAKQSGQAFSELRFDAVYSSDLQRAMETAEIFLTAQTEGQTEGDNKKTFSSNLSRTKEPMFNRIIPSKKLREVGFGYYEGLENFGVWRLAEHKAIEEGLAKEGDVINEAIKIDMLHLLDPYHLAENYEGFIDRLKEGILEIVEQHTTGQILIVSHSSSIKALFNTLDEDYQTTVDPENGSMSVMTYENGKFTVKAYNIFSDEGLK